MAIQDRPSLAMIENEIAAYKRFLAVYSQGARPLPTLPGGERGPSRLIVLIWGGILLAGLNVLGLLARRYSLHRLRIWAARQRIALDELRNEPVSCGLNRDLTELGLALFSIGENSDAKDCLASSWKVYPCIHSVSFGLDSRLWEVLKEGAETFEVCAEYEHMARKFSLGREWPPKRAHIPLTRRIGAIVSSLLRSNRKMG